MLRVQRAASGLLLLLLLLLLLAQTSSADVLRSDKVTAAAALSSKILFADALERDADAFVSDVKTWIADVVGKRAGSDVVVTTEFALDTKGEFDPLTPCGDLTASKTFAVVKTFLDNPKYATLDDKMAESIMWHPSKACVSRKNSVEVDGGSHVEFVATCNDGKDLLLNVSSANGGLTKTVNFRTVETTGAFVGVTYLDRSARAIGATGRLISNLKLRLIPDKVEQILKTWNARVRECGANNALSIKGVVGGGWRQKYSKYGGLTGAFDTAVLGYAEAFEIKFAGAQAPTDSPVTPAPVMTTPRPVETPEPTAKGLEPIETPTPTTTAPDPVETAAPVDAPVPTTKAPQIVETPTPTTGVPKPVQTPEPTTKAPEPTATPGPSFEVPASNNPTEVPTKAPETNTPTLQPDTKPVTDVPGADAPTEPPVSSMPARDPTELPSDAPTSVTSETPTEEPTAEPTAEPNPGDPIPDSSGQPSNEPTATPSESPTTTLPEQPTKNPTEEPTTVPSEEPSEIPTASPSAAPTTEPNETSTDEPSEVPTVAPTEEPTVEPSEVPPEESSAEPTGEPSSSEAPSTPTSVASTSQPPAASTFEPALVDPEVSTAPQVSSDDPDAIPTVVFARDGGLESAQSELKALSASTASLYLQSGVECADTSFEDGCFMNAAVGKVLHGSFGSITLDMSATTEPRSQTPPATGYSLAPLVVLAFVGAALAALAATRTKGHQRRRGYAAIPGEIESINADAT